MKDKISLPTNWKIAPLEKIVAPSGGLRRGPFGSALKKSMFVEEGAKVYQQGNVLLNDFSYGHYFITPEKFQELKNFEVKIWRLFGMLLGNRNSWENGSCSQ